MKKLILTTFILICVQLPAFGQVAVIAHKAVPVDTINKSELLDFYTYDIKKWENNSPVVIIDLKPKSQAKTDFYKFLGKSISRMKSIWLKKMLSGEGDPPESVQSEDEVVQKVASTPGALGFARAEKVVTGKIKVLMRIPSDAEINR
jgi:ABC-type phosphate transport system substrate-binding protein